MLQSHCCEPDRKSPGHAAVLNALDSRALGSVSCYAQRFMRPGSYAYNVVPGYGQLLSSDHPFLVRVGEEKGRQMAQHNVVVSSAEEGFDVDPHELSINLGDLVLWSGNGRTKASFAVVGEQDFFNSQRMVNECGYSHAFGLAGEYRWIDAYGSGLRGTVRVSDPKVSDQKGFARWRKQLSEGKLVMIADGRVDHPELDIVVGQRVFFAVVTSGGISITDEQLLAIGADKAA